MIQEYLFIDDVHRKAVEEYSPEQIKPKIHDIENTSCWIVTYSIAGDNEESAKKLSQINDFIVENFAPTVLINESSAYFNRKLFPYINEFERKLRKFLYLKSAIYTGEKRIENIRDLESKDLGEIFVLLFTDAEFVKASKTKVNEKSWQYTKKEIIATLTELSEETVWAELNGGDAVNALSDQFIDVKNYRNDVMHAHNIDADTYKKAKKLFVEINEQLDKEISKIIQIAEEDPSEMETSQYNHRLNGALIAQNLANTLKQFSETIPSTAKINTDILREAVQYAQNYSSTIEADTTQLQEALRKMNVLEYYSGIDAIRKIVQACRDTVIDTTTKEKNHSENKE